MDQKMFNSRVTMTPTSPVPMLATSLVIMTYTSSVTMTSNNKEIEGRDKEGRGEEREEAV